MIRKVMLKEFTRLKDAESFVNDFLAKNRVSIVNITPLPCYCGEARRIYFLHMEYEASC